jgi:hypothetical protein
MVRSGIMHGFCSTTSMRPLAVFVFIVREECPGRGMGVRKWMLATGKSSTKSLTLGGRRQRSRGKHVLAVHAFYGTMPALWGYEPTASLYGEMVTGRHVHSPLASAFRLNFFFFLISFVFEFSHNKSPNSSPSEHVNVQTGRTLCVAVQCGKLHPRETGGAACNSLGHAGLKVHPARVQVSVSLQV